MNFLIFLAVTVFVLFGIMKMFKPHTGAHRYALNILIAIDQLLNTILMGDPDETMSSRIGKNAEKGHKFSIFMSNVLDWFEEDHCKKAMEYDEGKRGLLKR